MNIVKGLLIMLTAVLLSSTADAANKAIVVYFSHAGENYGVGNITEGNTAKAEPSVLAFLPTMMLVQDSRLMPSRVVSSTCPTATN
ncbi:MAG: hypothetical protein IKS45_10725, partial [Thermoguttaceae bacterium]|nr:hypothetical protein [Thermoguttaceae bacterium]